MAEQESGICYAIIGVIIFFRFHSYTKDVVSTLKNLSSVYISESGYGKGISLPPDMEKRCLTIKQDINNNQFNNKR